MFLLWINILHISVMIICNWLDHSKYSIFTHYVAHTLQNQIRKCTLLPQPFLVWSFRVPPRNQGVQGRWKSPTQLCFEEVCQSQTDKWLHYAGRRTISAGAIPSLASMCLLKTDVQAVLSGGSGISLQAAPTIRQNCPMHFHFQETWWSQTGNSCSRNGIELQKIRIGRDLRRPSNSTPSSKSGPSPTILF